MLRSEPLADLLHGDTVSSLLQPSHVSDNVCAVCALLKIHEYTMAIGLGCILIMILQCVDSPWIFVCACIGTQY